MQVVLLSRQPVWWVPCSRCRFGLFILPRLSSVVFLDVFVKGENMKLPPGEWKDAQSWECWYICCLGPHLLVFSSWEVEKPEEIHIILTLFILPLYYILFLTATSNLSCRKDQIVFFFNWLCTSLFLVSKIW